MLISRVGSSGYRSPYSQFESPNGVDTFPIIYSYPLDKRPSHLPALIIFIDNHHRELDTVEPSIAYYYDNQAQSTFFLTRPDPKMTFIVTFEQTQKHEKDENIVNFIQEINLLLKGSKMFLNLKPSLNK